ncbi:MAG TPA: HAD family hydrolase [Syntrophales bacterium]|nr:HAD family hydrolase [Syntrophales bacterium]HRS87014.1 HAD family hydrolase [Syntrophales bacterium]HRV41892.1 HAD family hydrolase [Syntrophales bacterium]
MGKLLLFDFDGVLVDSLEIYTRAVEWCLKRVGMPIVVTVEDYLELFEGNFYEALRERGVDLDAFAAALKEYSARVNYYGDVKAVAGISPVVEALGRDHTLLIISSNSARAIGRIIARFTWNGSFRAILGSEDAFSKREKIDRARKRFAFPPGETYYIGDTAGDIREGKEAGVVTVAATWGWHTRERLLAAGPDLVVDNPRELLTLFGAGQGRQKTGAASRGVIKGGKR